MPSQLDQRHTNTIDLDIGGMTCASCAARVERRLDAIEGVEASVNFATETARVRYPEEVAPAELIRAVEKAGYSAHEHASLARPARSSSSGGQADAGGRGTGTHSGPAARGSDVGADSGGAESAAPDAAEDLRRRLVVSAIFAVPVMVLSMVPALQFTYWQWVVMALALPVVTYGAWPFYRAAGVNLRHGALTMDTLVAMGTLAATGWSLWAMLLGQAGEPGLRHEFSLGSGSMHHAASAIYFEAAAGVTTFILLGRWIEARSKKEASAAIRALMELGAKQATVLEGGNEVQIPASALDVGDLFVVRPGQTVATDGVVENGESAVDTSMLTGESVPVEVGPGDAVTGATLNTSGRLVVRATRVGAETQLAKMAEMVAAAQTEKAPVQRLVDRISMVFVPLVIATAVVTFIAWWLVDGSLVSAFTASVAVLIIACPCALGLATPMALMVGTGNGARRGILISGPSALESSRGIDTVVFDKTGTLTTGQMSVHGVEGAPGVSEDEVLAYVAAVESGSEHPIARAIVTAARERGLEVPELSGFRSIAGRGVVGAVAGQQMQAGRGSTLAKLPAGKDRGLAARAAEWEERGATVVAAYRNGEAFGIVAVADSPKPEARDAVAQLRELGLRVSLLTGDNRGAALAAAQAVGIAADDVIAEVMPGEKLEQIAKLQGEGRKVAMVGDGVNDAPALARADLGIAMGTGSDAAIQAGDITLVSGDPRKVAAAIRLARRTLGNIRGNLFWAFAYNVVAIPVAALGLLTPMLAGAAMAFSSVFVVLNSLRLRK